MKSLVRIISFRAYLAAVLIMIIAGCATLPLKGRADLLTFLVDGKTTRADVLTTLGQPSGRFENDKILTYRLGFQQDNKGYYVVERVADVANQYQYWANWKLAKYSLVLCFDDAGIMRKHSLVEVN